MNGRCIHWHGIILPANMDGVQGLGSFYGHRPDTYVYTFGLSRTGLTGTTAIPRVCRNREGYTVPLSSCRGPGRCTIVSVLVMLSDWTDENPHSLLQKKLKTVSYYNFNKANR